MIDKIYLISLLALALASGIYTAEVYGELTSLAANGDCKFYLELDAIKECGVTGYPLSYGYKYCVKFGENSQNFNEDGKIWITSVRKCLITKLLRMYKPMNCKQIEDFAFGTHPTCYVDPGYGSKGICDIWFSQNAAGLFTTLELKDFFKGAAIIQIFVTASSCVQKYGEAVFGMIGYLLNSFNPLG